MKNKSKNILLCFTGTLLILALAAVITLAILFSNEQQWHRDHDDKSTTTIITDKPTTTQPPVDDLKKRINCFPEEQGTNEKPWTVTQEQCDKRGCRFDRNTGGDAFVPICYMHPKEIGYKVVEKVVEKDFSVSLLLEPLSLNTIFDPPVRNVSVKVQLWNPNQIEIKIEDANTKRYEVPLLSHLVKDPLVNEANCELEFSYTENPFAFKVIRKATKTILLDTSLGGFVFSDRFLQLATLLPSKNFYGLGEHEHPSLRHDMDRYRTWPMFARDQGGLGEGNNLYGTHPFYMVLEMDGNAHGVFVLNSNAQEFATIPAPGIIYRTIGGILDLYIASGNTPEKVVQQHTAMVGRPFLPPYWSLGFHLSRYGYNNLTALRDAVNRTRNAEIPLDVIYADIDHMDKRRDFTVDNVNFAGLGEYFETERIKNGLRSVIILDPAIPRVDNINETHYQPWWDFYYVNGYITWPNHTNMFGYVWPDDLVTFPDFFDQQAKLVWIDLIAKHFKKVPFDGIWIDMNEPANFGTNEEKPWNWPADKPAWSLKCPESYYDDPPYPTWAALLYSKKIADKTLCMVAVQAGKYIHYDVHNLFGWSQTPPTLEGVRKAHPGKRGFVLTRSTFAGSGQYATHWLGDNLATWEHMQRSIISMLEMSMFGLAHTGPDICGFMKQTTPELCLRWMQLGAFYPYSRNHNDIVSTDQDPVAMGPEVAETSAYYLKLRYQGLPYLYTLFYYANTAGSTVARPVFFQFPTDQMTWGIDRQFMLGPSYMIAPLLNKGESTVSAYVPKGTWVSLALNNEFIDHCQAGANKNFEVNGTVFLQCGGSIVPTQNAMVPVGTAITTEATRKNAFTLNVVLDCAGIATGSLFWDDGDSLNTIADGKFILAEFVATQDTTKQIQLSVQVTHSAPENSTFADNLRYKWFSIYGKNLRPITKIEVTCAQMAPCPAAFCEPYSETSKFLPCSFEGQGIPITEAGFIITIAF